MKAKQYIHAVHVITLLIVLVVCHNVFAQRMGGKGFVSKNLFGKDLFLYELYNFADPDDDSKSLVEFHFSFVNDILTFVKMENGTFNAQYEINIIFYNKKNRAVAENSVKNKLSVNTYAETNSRLNPYQNLLSVSLPPGEYYYIVKMIENNIPETLIEKTKIKLRPFYDNRLHVSDIVFVDKIDCDSDPVTFQPNLKNAFDKTLSDFSAYMVLYSKQKSDSLSISYKISDAQKEQIFTRSEKIQITNNKKSYCVPLKGVIKKPGLYFLTINARAGKQSIETQKKFHVNWSKTRIQQNNIELAIEQLKLISNKKIVAGIKEAPENERKSRYDQFWTERDPTPGTPENELKTEFFQRVNFSNQNFAETFPPRDGWETDRGEIYIKYGPPTQVERQQAELSRPGVEVWYYIKLDRRYFFADRNGNGVYRLVRVE